MIKENRLIITPYEATGVSIMLISKKYDEEIGQTLSEDCRKVMEVAFGGKVTKDSRIEYFANKFKKMSKKIKYKE